MKTYEIVTKTTVTQQELNDLVITAVEGGIGYWSVVKEWNESIWEDSVEDITIDLMELTPDSNDWRTIKASDLASVLSKLPNYNIGGLNPGSNVREYIDNMDAEIADAAIQLAVFGEVIYG